MSEVSKNESSQLRAERLQHEYQAVLDAAIDAIVIIDSRGSIELVNHAGERVFGYSEAELLGKNVSILMPQPYRAEHDGYLNRYHATGKASIIGIGREVQAQRRDGSTFDVDLAVGRIEGSEPPRFVGFIRDITKRKKAEEALRRSEAELNAAQTMANIGNYVVHVSENLPHYFSPQYWRILGRDAVAGEVTLAGYLEQIVHHNDRERLAAAVELMNTTTASLDIVYRIIRPDGSIRQVHHIAQAARDNDGRVLRHFGTLHDITERQHAEDEARQMQARLTHFGRISTMGEMAAGIAHEINQPLAAIATYAQGCIRFMNDPRHLNQDDLVEGLKQIEAQALRAGEVIRRLRSFVKNREVRREPIDANQVLEDLLILAQTDTRHHGVRIVLECAANLPQIHADPVQVQQVILNLLRNSIDAMVDLPREQREITLATRRDEQGDVEFSVSDRGPGLSEQAQAELFNPFFTTKAGGTGLGLAISLSIVRAHGGKVWYRPRSGGGASFFFTLPVAQPRVND
jgi:two-component system, LuxR family, sensor kinase FixL